MNFKDKFKGFAYFGQALKAAKQDMWTSVQVLLVLTLVLSVVLFGVEHIAQPDKYASLWDSIVWGFMSYLGNPGNFSPGEPITLVGRFIAVIMGVVKIMIFAVPAGLVAKGFGEAMTNDKRNKELAEYHRIMCNSYPAGVGRRLKEHLKQLPLKDAQGKEAWYAHCNFGYITNNIATSEFMLKGIDLNNVLAVCRKYPEFRVKNEATAKSMEDGRQDRYVVEYFPVNRRYGYMINRGSKVTIVSTSSSSEIGIGNFSYYLAKFAGFNYISKDFNAADGESFYNNRWAEPFYEGITLKERMKEHEEQGDKISKQEVEAYENKKVLREEFLRDLESMCKDEDSWVICMLSSAKKTENVGKEDLLFVHKTSEQEGNISAIHSPEKKAMYDKIIESLNKAFAEYNFNLSAYEETTTCLFPLLKRSNKPNAYRNLLFKLQDDGCKCNGFVIRVSRDLISFNVNLRPVLFEISKTIHDVIEPDRNDCLSETERKDLNRSNRCRGFADQEIERVKNTLFWSEV